MVEDYLYEDQTEKDICYITGKLRWALCEGQSSIYKDLKPRATLLICNNGSIYITITSTSFFYSQLVTLSRLFHTDTVISGLTVERTKE